MADSSDVFGTIVSSKKFNCGCIQQRSLHAPRQFKMVQVKNVQYKRHPVHNKSYIKEEGHCVKNRFDGSSTLHDVPVLL